MNVPNENASAQAALLYMRRASFAPLYAWRLKIAGPVPIFTANKRSPGASLE